MAKLKPSNRTKESRKAKERSILNDTQVPRSKAHKLQIAMDPVILLTQATTLLQTGQPDAALPIARRALNLLQPASNSHTPLSLPVLNLLGEIYLELGDPSSATTSFLQAVSLDPEGAVAENEGGGAEKFLWLAQLCEDGGEESIKWFDKGTQVLERDIVDLEVQMATRTPEEEERKVLLEEKKRKLAAALCGMVEVWMTDLSLSPAAESACTALITRALAISPNAPTLQTQASLLLSQCDLAGARSALRRSLSLWQDLPPEHPDIPDFPTRISLSRLLMEAGLEDSAISVLEGLVAEEDGSVEAWYLGGWCAFLMAETGNSSEEAEAGDGKDSMEEILSAADVTEREGKPKIKEEKSALLITSRDWMKNSLRLYEIQEYEDDRLRDHAIEVVEQINGMLGDTGDDEGVAECEGWEDDDDDEEGYDKNGDSDVADLEMNGT